MIGSAGTLLLQTGFTYRPFMNALFHAVPMPPVSWLWAVTVGVIALLTVVLKKRLRHRGDRSARCTGSCGKGLAGAIMRRIWRSGGRLDAPGMEEPA